MGFDGCHDLLNLNDEKQRGDRERNRWLMAIREVVILNTIFSKLGGLQRAFSRMLYLKSLSNCEFAIQSWTK